MVNDIIFLPILYSLSYTKHLFSVAILMQSIQHLFSNPADCKSHFLYITEFHSNKTTEWFRYSIVLFEKKKYFSCICFHWILGTVVQGHGAIAVKYEQEGWNGIFVKLFQQTMETKLYKMSTLSPL